MPEYLNLAGKPIKEYSPESISIVKIIDLGFRYAYCLEELVRG